MYDSFFGFRKRPFLANPTLERYFPAEGIEQAFATVSKTLTRGDGPVAIMGPTGCGKTLLCLRIADAWRKNFDVILLSSARLCTSRALLQSLLFELRMPYRDLSEGELRLSLMERLQPSIENPSDGLILIVDEAQALSLKLLEELRGLTNLSRDGLPRVRLILVGSLRLDELLGHPRMESLNQRLATRCYLTHLTANETVRYVKHKIELAGVPSSHIFSEDALRAIHKATSGVPRLVDQVADHVLELAEQVEQRPVSVALVDRAWRELQQIPGVWDHVQTPAMPSIEFGSLDEDDNDEAEFEIASPISKGPTTSFVASEPAAPLSPFSYLDEEFGGMASANPVQANRLLKLTSEVSPPLALSQSDYDEHLPIEINHVIERVQASQSIEPNPFGDDYVDEFAIDVRPFTGVASNFPQEPEFSPVARSPFPTFSIPILDFEEEPILAVESLEREVRDLIAGLNSEASQLQWSLPIEWQSTINPPVYQTSSKSDTQVVQNLSTLPISTLQANRDWTADSNYQTSNIASPYAESLPSPPNGKGPSTPNLTRGATDSQRAKVAAKAEQNSVPSHDTGFTEPSHILSFAKLGNQWQAMGDDRDLLIIEEEVASHPVKMVSKSEPESPNHYNVASQTPHSYVQLFSMLRS